MPNPHEVLSQLLSPAQADRLQDAGQAAWASVGRTLSAFLGAELGLSGLDGRLVMPDEIAGEFEQPHLVAPIELSTAQDQTATAYAVAPTAFAAGFFDSAADDPNDEEQQTIVMASTMLGQVIQALNREVFGNSPIGLVVSLDDLTANTMPMLLGVMEEPALALTLQLAGNRALPLTFIFPGTFLDIVAGALPAAASPSASAASAIAPGLGFSLTADDLDGAELIDPGDVPRAAPTPARPVPPPVFQQPAAPPPPPPPPQREPTPITTATAHRARFAPLPASESQESRSRMDLLANLQMNVSVELGRTEITVAEVLGLGPGSVIELDRLAGEPVDILVNDRLIARGEVVVVDENFGVRVVEVVRRGAEQEERVS